MMTTPNVRHLEVEDIGDVAVVHFTGKKLLDPKDIQTTGEQLCRLVDDLGRRNLILDFSNVEYLSSTALGKFNLLHKKVESAGGRLMMRNMNAQIQELFELCDFARGAVDEPRFIAADTQSRWGLPLEGIPNLQR